MPRLTLAGLIIVYALIIANIQTPTHPVYSEKDIEPVIEFDKSVYGPFDSVQIKIIYPPANTDPTRLDELIATIFSSPDTSTKFRFSETGYDAGVFFTSIQLTPDPDKWWGTLKVQRDGYLSIEFKSKDNLIFTEKVDVNFNLGRVVFDKDGVSPRERMEIIVWDPDRNAKPNVIEILPVMVWSTTEILELNGHGLMVALREINPNSSEFRRSISFTTSEKSSGTILRVSNGDTVTAKYTDNTLLPRTELSHLGFETFEMREVFASVLISDCGFCEPMKRATMTEPQIFTPADRAATSVTQLDTADTAIIRTEITNKQNTDNQFAYITQVKNSDDVVVSLSWIQGGLGADETMKAESTWIPVFPGTYVIETFLWRAIDYAEPLSAPQQIEVKVK